MPKWSNLLKVVFFLNYLKSVFLGFLEQAEKTLNSSVVFRVRSINPWPRISRFAVSTISQIILIWLMSLIIFPCGGVVSSWRIIHKRLSVSTSLVTFALLPVTIAAVVRISHSMALSVALLVELMARTIWQQQLTKIERAKTFTVTVSLKDTAITFTRGKCEWVLGCKLQ